MVVCEHCGTMLRIDKRLDHEQVIDSQITIHRLRDCPRGFHEEKTRKVKMGSIDYVLEGRLCQMSTQSEID